MPKKLYHYTSPLHLNWIVQSGFLKVVESNVSIQEERAGKDVVWLTDQEYWRSPKMLQGVVDKTAVRFTVDAPDAQRADKWLRNNGATPETIEILEKSGGASAKTWYVVEHPIPSSAWLSVEYRGAKRNQWKTLDWQKYALELGEAK